MAEYIERDKAVESIKELMSSMPAKDNYAKGYDAAIGRALIAVRQVLAADVQPVKRGNWEWNAVPKFGNPYGSYQCSKCTYIVPEEENYCPNCGAKMIP